MSSVRCVFLIDDQDILRTLNKTDQDLERSTYSCRLASLRLLCCLSQNYGKSPQDVQWGYSFFNSEGSALQIIEKQTFYNFDLNSFEEFEEKVVNRTMHYTRMSLLKCKSKIRMNNSPQKIDNYCGKSSLIKNIINQIFTDYTWDVPDMSSPIKSARKNFILMKPTPKNFIFVISPLSSYSPEIVILNLLKDCKSTKDVNIEIFWMDTSNSSTELDLTRPLLKSPIRVFSLNSLALDASSSLRPNTANMEQSYFAFKSSLMTTSTVLGNLFGPKPEIPLRKSVLFILNEKLSCRISLSKICETSNPQWQEECFASLTSLKFVASVHQGSSLFSQMIGITFSCSKDGSSNTLFDFLLQHSAQKHHLLVIECQMEGNKKKIGLLQPLTPVLGCLVIPQFCDSFRQKVMPNKALINHPSRSKDYSKSETGEFESAKVFHTSCLEKWASPQITHLPEISNDTEVDPGLKTLLEELRSITNKHKSTLQATRSKVLRNMKPLSAQEFGCPRQSPRLRKCKSATLNVSFRSTRLVQQSLCGKAKKPANSPKSKKILPISQNGTKLKESAATCLLNFRTEGLSEDSTVISNLQTLYDQAATSDQCDLISCAQTISNILVHHVNCHSEKGKLSTVLELAEKHFLLSSKSIAEKFGTPSKKQRRIREYKLQILILMELEIVFQGSHVNNNCAEKVTILLRMFSFLVGTLELNKFLIESLKENYGETLHNTLEEIGEELNFPIFPDESQSSQESDDEEIFVRSHPNSLRSNTSATSIASQKTDVKRSLIRHPSMVNFESKRQITVPKILVTKNVKSKASSKEKKLKKKVAAVPRENSVTKRKSAKRNKQEMKRVCRNLFKAGKSPQKDIARLSLWDQSSQGKSQKLTNDLHSIKEESSRKKNAVAKDGGLLQQIVISKGVKKIGPSNSQPSFFFQELMSSPVNFRSQRTPNSKSCSSQQTPSKSSVTRTPIKLTPNRSVRSPKSLIGCLTPAKSSVPNTPIKLTPKRSIKSPKSLFGCHTPTKSSVPKTPIKLTPNRSIRSQKSLFASLTPAKSSVPKTPIKLTPNRSIRSPKSVFGSPASPKKNSSSVAKTPVKVTPSRSTRTPKYIFGSPTSKRNSPLSKYLTPVKLNNRKAKRDPESPIEFERSPKQCVRQFMSKSSLGLSPVRKSPRLASKFSNGDDFESPTLPELTPQVTPKTPQRQARDNKGETPIESFRSHKISGIGRSPPKLATAMERLHESSESNITTPKNPVSSCITPTSRLGQSSRGPLRSRNLSSVFKTATKSVDSPNKQSPKQKRFLKSPDRSSPMAHRSGQTLTKSPRSLTSQFPPELQFDLWLENGPFSTPKSHKNDLGLSKAKHTRSSCATANKVNQLSLNRQYSATIVDESVLTNNSKQQEYSSMPNLSKMKSEKSPKSCSLTPNSKRVSYYIPETVSESSNLPNHWPIKKPNVQARYLSEFNEKNEMAQDKLFETVLDRHKIGTTSQSPSKFQSLNDNLIHNKNSRVSPPLKRLCSDKGYGPPSALGLLHLTASPVLDL